DRHNFAGLAPAAVALVPDELRGPGVTRGGPGAREVTPGFICGAGGVCGTGIAEIPGFAPTVPRLVEPPVAASGRPTGGCSTACAPARELAEAQRLLLRPIMRQLGSCA